jgi:two-component system copper resistance phosphate regulon response regulator CusR
MARVLFVEDDKDLATAVEMALEAQNFVVEVVHDGKSALDRLTFGHYDVAIVDWMLPQMSGYEVCQEYRRNGGQTPILFLTGQSDVMHRVQALDTGADDYLCKPFAYAELMSRVRALLRRFPKMENQVISLGHLELDVQRCRAKVEGKDVDLAPSEFALLELLMKHQGRIFSADDLLDRVFKLDREATGEAVRQRILRLRKKIDLDGKPSLIKTVKGLGYCMEEAAES